MAAALQPYSRYKDSGVEWLRDVPAHWEVRRLRTVAEMRVSNVDKHSKDGERPIRLCNYVDVYKSDRIRMEMPFMTATAAPEEIERFQLRPGDVLITKDSEAWNDIGVPALVEGAAGNTICGYHLALLRPWSGCVSGDFLFRAVQSSTVAYQFHVRANGVTRYGLTHNAIKSIWLPLPSPPEQATIVRFLDHAERRIRRYIRAKERLLGLLEEQEHVIVHHAVSGQTDVRTGQPYTVYKDSGVEWLGRVPAHWEVTHLGRLITLTVGFPFKSEGFTRSDNDTRLLRGVNIAPGRIRWGDVVRWPLDDVPLFSEYRLQAGDIVLGMDRPIVGDGIRVAVLAQSDVPSLLLQRVARLRPSRRLLRDFAFRLLSGRSFSDYLAPIFTGISVPHVSPEQIKGFRVALPSVAEQQTIVDYLHSRVGSLRAAMKRTGDEIMLLREYRARLIADVVTGRLDVREVAAGHPNLDPLATEQNPDDDFIQPPSSEASGDAEEGGPTPDVDAERSEAATPEFMAEG